MIYENVFFPLSSFFHNVSFVPVVWWSKTDLSRPIDHPTDRDGRAQFYASPRGYAVYAMK